MGKDKERILLLQILTAVEMEESSTNRMGIAGIRPGHGARDLVAEQHVGSPVVKNELTHLLHWVQPDWPLQFSIDS